MSKWETINTAPEDKLCVVGWHDFEDKENPERHDFDWKEDGVWQMHADMVEHARSVAPAGSRMPTETPPYTHWMEIPVIPMSPNTL